MALSSALASFSYGGTTVSEVGSASVTLSRPALETTAIGTNAQSFIAGIGGATATLDIYYDQSGAAHTALQTAANTGSGSAECVLTLASGQTYTGDAFVTEFAVTAQAGSLTRATVNLQFTTVTPGSAIVTFP